MPSPHAPGRRRVAAACGFTLIEVMVTVAIVAILAAIAVTAYTRHITRSRIPEATANLSTWQVRMEQWFQDNQTYYASNGSSCGVAAPATTKFFSFACVASSKTAFVLTATGINQMAGFSYTIDQDGSKGSVITASGWAGTSTTCWINDTGGSC